MSGRGRFVVLGLAHPRADWFRRVAQWANAAALPIEFVKCLSGDELRARLVSGRAHSAVMLDASLPAVDRDLLAVVADARCASIVVDVSYGSTDAINVARNWFALGASALLVPDFDRAALLDVLSEHGRPISTADEVPSALDDSSLPPWRGAVIAVVGTGGTGTSTIAMAGAQALAQDVRYGGSVVLLDACRNAEQAMLHDCGAVSPGVQELVEAHRNGRPTAGDISRLAFASPERGYDLIVGLRRSRFWASIRPAAFRSAFSSMTRVWQAVIVDTDADLEGESEGGSADIEERNVMSRTAIHEADVVLVVGQPSLKGLHSLTRLLVDLAEHGVRPERVIPVLNQAPRTPRQRAGCTAVLADLIPSRRGAGALPPVFVPVRPVDRFLRDGHRFPKSMVDPVDRAIRSVLRGHDGVDRVVVAARERFVRVRPGSLGSYGDDDNDPVGFGEKGIDGEVAG